jgi:hypothetical protein
MRKVLFALAATTAAIAVAAPASAQYYPGQPYGNGYNHNGYGRVRALQVRVDQIQRQLGRLVQVRAITRNEFRNRNEDARDIERRLRRDARDGRGLSQNELYGLENRIVRLEQKIARDTRDGHGYGYGYNNYGNGNGNGYYDRDRDGRDDRYEDDHGNRRDR